MTLKDGKTGMTLKIQQIGDSDLKERLMTMGLTPGTKVKVLRSALRLVFVPTIWLCVAMMQPRFRCSR